MEETIERQDVEEPVDDGSFVHLRFTGFERTYLCGLLVGREPVHGFWHPKDPNEVCPHCGMPICPTCADLGRVFHQLEDIA